MTDSLKFTFTDIVYHKTNNKQVGIVIGILYKQDGYYYQINWGNDHVDYHSEFELSDQPLYIDIND